MDKATRAVHEKRVPLTIEKSVAPPIYQTCNFSFEKAQDLGNIISGGPDNESYIYTRGSNPTQRALEKTVANVEGAEDAICTSSGMAAITLVALTFLKQGDHVVLSHVTYGDTHHLFDSFLSKFGVETTIVDMTNPENVKNAIQKNTKMVYFETPSNPLLRLIDIEEVSKIVKGRGIKLVVDNTLMSPYFQQPLKHGANISIHSLTKFIGGHSDVVGGIVLCNKKDRLDLRMSLFTTGSVLDPNAAWLVLRGLKTLGVRMEKHQANTLEIVKFLLGHPKVEKVNHPSVPGHPDIAVFRKQMDGMPSVLSIEIKGGYKQTLKFINKLKIFSRAVSLGGVESLAEHPASMTHSIVPKAEREKAGIKDTLVRLSIGIESVDDLIADLRQALL